MPERVILSTYPLLDFLTRLLTRVRVLFLLDSKPAGYRLLTGHGKGPWDDIGDRWKHILIDYDFAENVFPPSLPQLTLEPPLDPHLTLDPHG